MNLFGKKSTQTIVVVDIRSSSIGAASVLIRPDAVPQIVYSVRLPLDPQSAEPLEEAMPRTLEAVVHALITEGAPLLVSASGSGKVGRILVTITGPWQESHVHSTVIAEETPFLFTQHVLDTALAKERSVSAERVQVSEMIIATLLNGYEVENPFGKRVRHAELIMLSSGMDEVLVAEIHQKMRKAFHQGHIEVTAFMPELYAVTRELYPHQHDFLVLDVGNAATDLLLVKHGLLASISSINHGVGEIARAARTVGVSSPTVPLNSSVSLIDTSRNAEFTTSIAQAEAAWIQFVHASLAEIARQEPLPRTIFLLAEESVRDFLRRLLDAPELRSLWLSKESIGVLPMLPTQFTPFVTVREGEVPDPALALLALSANRRYGPQ